MKPLTRNISYLLLAFCLIGFGIYNFIIGKTFWALFDFVLGLTNILLTTRTPKMKKKKTTTIKRDEKDEKNLDDFILKYYIKR